MLKSTSRESKAESWLKRTNLLLFYGPTIEEIKYACSRISALQKEVGLVVHLAQRRVQMDSIYV